jgi:acyl-CoA synthetase (NDP forming)
MNFLHPIVNPKSIAFFGASNRFSSMGTNQLNSVLDLGFEGKVYPLHPKEETVLGLKAYKRVADLPEVPDLAVMVLPTPIVPQVMEECGHKGIKHAVVVSGGFTEVGGEGPELEKKLLAIASQYGIRFLGPNCLGVANPHHKFNVTFLPFEGRSGFIGFASQSGSFITQMFGYLSRYDIGFSTGISVGNEADRSLYRNHSTGQGVYRYGQVDCAPQAHRGLLCRRLRSRATGQFFAHRSAGRPG